MQLKEDTTKTVEFPVPPVAEATEERLDDFSALLGDDYRDFKQTFLEWLLIEGRDTYKREGYADATVRTTHYKVEEAYRWLWEREESYTKEFTPDDATELIEFLVRRTTHPETYVYTFEKSLKRLFKFFREKRNKDIPEWSHDIPLDTNSDSSTKDKFYPEEMRALYEAALAISSVKSYHSVSRSERDQIKAYLAQRFEMPKSEIGAEEFERANSWKIPSIVSVSSDCGLRPIEVGRAKVDWFNLENKKMLVPKDESTKNDAEWECALSSKSVTAVSNWLSERGSYDLYDGRDAVWLTRTGNTYGSGTLNRVLSKLIEAADLDQQGRNLSWYSFRHGSASMWAEQEGIYLAKNQLRHKNVETTMRYTRGSVDAATKAADSMW
ncbi:tyrosine-type recombinase/integrase [Haloplanus salinarum]|uniref:tyrosine-type recombinase/integrase n=1 Tax=Haloplanus salinarum TaxID=1912324 RepID=UPI00214BA00B|nr:site-specific integrase [Haloplanus salinarum]